MIDDHRTVPAGPPLPVPAVAFAVLTGVAAVLGAAGPRPDTPPAEVLALARAHAGAMGAGSAALLGSAIPLVVLAATAVRRVERAAPSAPGPLMALAGSVLAAASLSVAALAGWAGAVVAPYGDAVLAKLLAAVWFGAGGPGFVVPLGLVLLGLAIPVVAGGGAPRVIGWLGVVVGVCALATVLAPAAPVLYPLLPVGRFGGVVVLLALAFTLRDPLPGASR
ncbi:hypothetical protein GCM10025792_38620 [Pseudonocardia tropica]